MCSQPGTKPLHKEVQGEAKAPLSPCSQKPQEVNPGLPGRAGKIIKFGENLLIFFATCKWSFSADLVCLEPPAPLWEAGQSCVECLLGPAAHISGFGSLSASQQSFPVPHSSSTSPVTQTKGCCSHLLPCFVPLETNLCSGTETRASSGYKPKCWFRSTKL